MNYVTLGWTVSLTFGLEVLTYIEAAIAEPGLRPVAEFNRKTYANQFKKKKTFASSYKTGYSKF